MTERELLYVKTIVEEHSISKAAQKLYVSQPSLSTCIQKIEKQLGTKLFNRTNNGLVQTFAGERYYQLALDVMKIYRNFEIEMTDINNLKKGRIVFGITVYLATHVLPIILPAFKKQCPNIEVQIIEQNSTNLDKALLAGDINFAVMHSFPNSEPEQNALVDIYPLFKDPFLLVTQKDHRLKKYAQQDSACEYPKIDLALFNKEPFILLNEGQKIRQISDLILQQAAFEPDVLLITKSFETARRLSSEGVGVSFIPRQYIGIFPNSYEADYYYLDQKYNPYWTLCVKAQQHAYLSKAERLFIRMLGSQFGTKGLMDDNTI